jgi:hypothetical protein
LCDRLSQLLLVKLFCRHVSKKSREIVTARLTKRKARDTINERINFRKFIYNF